MIFQVLLSHSIVFCKSNGLLDTNTMCQEFKSSKIPSIDFLANSITANCYNTQESYDLKKDKSSIEASQHLSRNVDKIENAWEIWEKPLSKWKCCNLLEKLSESFNNSNNLLIVFSSAGHNSKQINHWHWLHPVVHEHYSGTNLNG